MVLSQINQSAVNCINPNCERPYPQPWGNKFCNSCGTQLQLLDRYYPIQPLGSGGFAQIYTVWDTKTQTEKVLKVLVENSPKALELFIQEAEVLSSFHHPGVPRVEADGYFQINLPTPKPHQLACLVMEKIDGQNLEEIRIGYPQGCPQKLVLNWFIQAVKILKELHQRQIIHRDIKPSNLMLRNSSTNAAIQTEQLVLIDFGGAKQFSGAILRPNSSTRLFSSGYSPPEQISGGNIGPAADFYALGRTIIELLTGKNPQELEDPMTGELNWRKWCVNLNADLADLLDQMIQVDVRSRPAHAGIIHKRLLKITNQIYPTKSKPGLFNQGKNYVVETTREFTQAFLKITFSILETIFKFILACLTTIWTMFVVWIGATVGTLIGFLLADYTKFGILVEQFISDQLPTLIPNFQTAYPREIIIYGVVGLGTAWGITIAGSFGQKRQFFVSAILGVFSYSSAWLICQFLQIQNAPEGLITWILISQFILNLGLGIRSHHLAYAFISAFGTANIIAGLIHLGIDIPLIDGSQESLWMNISRHIIFFGSIGILTTICLAFTYYLILPCLKWLGWR